MKTIENYNEIKPAGNTKVANEYKNLDELRSHLYDLSSDLENELKDKKTIYDNKRIEALRKPFKLELMNIILTEDYDLSKKDDVEKHVICYNQIPRLDSGDSYDSLFDILKNDLDRYIKDDIKEKYHYLKSDLKENYDLKLNDDSIFYFLNVKSNDVEKKSYDRKGEEFIERWGLPVSINGNNTKFDRFYIVDEGFKIIYDKNNLHTFRGYSKECLEDFIKNGKDLKIDSCKYNIKN